MSEFAEPEVFGGKPGGAGGRPRGAAGQPGGGHPRPLSMSEALVSRRAVLGGIAAGVAVTATGCSHAPAASALRTGPSGSSGSTGGATSRAGRATSVPWQDLAASIQGDVLLPGDPGYAQAKELFNPRWDTIRPAAVVEVASSDDVSEAITFARKYGVACRPKAGGHSYVGASTIRGGMVVSVSRLDHTTYDASTQIATVGAGSKLYPVHAALAGHGRTIPTGTCPTVGAAGLTLGGGVGVASRQYGLTADQLVSARMVSASGAVREIDAQRTPNLLWALKGGGGGNFGVVTLLRYHTQPALSFGFFILDFSWSHAAAVLRGWAARIGPMPHSAWANVHLDASSDGSTDVRIVGVCRDGDQDTEAAAMEAAIGYDATDSSLFTKSFLDGIQFLGGGTSSPRQGFAAGSDVVASMSTTLSNALVKVIADRAASRHSGTAILDPLTGAVHGHTPTATAFPWRRHLADIQWYLNMPAHPTLDQIHAAYDWIAQAHSAVAGSSVGGYVNYLEPRRTVGSYYGANFARLKSIKAQVDPDHFFTSPYGIP